MYVVLALLALLPVFIVGQILRVHIGDGAELKEQGERQASSFVTIPAMRGVIFDRAGRTLAVNAPRYDLALDPTTRGFTPAVAGSFFERLSKLTGESRARIERRVNGRRSPQYVLLARNLSERQKEEIDGWDVPGLILTERYARRYTYDEAAAHVLGFVDTDGRGIAGVELQYDEFLRGEDGRRAVKRDRLGMLKASVGGQVVDPHHGESIVLTIDLVRQAILEEELARGVADAGARWGTAVAIDPHTGAILAMASAPTYNPNRASSYRDDVRRLHAITDRMEPGSTFKLVSAVAALEQGVISLSDTIDTGNGSAVFGGRTMRDTRAHGRISFEDAIAVSSNVGTASTILKVDDGAFYQYVRNFGFGLPTFVDLPGEVSGTLPNPRNWNRTSKTSMSIGYAIDATPLQIVTAYAALANGGLLVQPHIVAERRDVTGRTTWTVPMDSVRRAFDAETARSLIPAFEKAVTEGTARQAQIEGMKVAGKTGTARKVQDGAYVSGAYRASFVGFFPADEPAVAMIVVMDEPRTSVYGGVVAAPVFQRTAQRWLATLPEVADHVAPRDTLPDFLPVEVEDFTGKPAAVATARLSARNLQVAWPDEQQAFLPVSSQLPAPGERTVPLDRTRITLADTRNDTDPQMPDLTGLTAREAMYWLRAMDVDVRIEGSGTVIRQSPQAGAPRPETAILTLR